MNDRSAPAKGAPESIAADSPSVSAARALFAQLADCVGPDDPLFRAASLLADAWQPALDRSFRLGYENGYGAGFWDAERDMADAWAKAAQPVRETLRQPTHGELAARRDVG